jgi:hypothetical protein
VNSKTLIVLGAAVAVATAPVPSLAAAQSTGRSGYEPVLNSANFVRKVNNPYFTWPVGRTLTTAESGTARLRLTWSTLRRIRK